MPPAPVNAVLSAALAIEAKALRAVNMPIGSSVLCLARRRDVESTRGRAAAAIPAGDRVGAWVAPRSRSEPDDAAEVTSP